MAGVAIEFHPTAFSVGGPMAAFAEYKHKAVWDMSSAVESKPHIGSHTSTPGRGNGTPNRLTIKVRYGSPSWLDTVNEFNLLTYNEVRSAIANAVEQDVLVVIAVSGSGTAFGALVTVPKANLVDGETVVITDATGTAYTFYFDVSGTYVPGGGYDATNIQVDISGDTTADDVATTLAAAINASVFTAPVPGANVVNVTQTAPGVTGNRLMSSTVADPGFTVDGLGGGGAVAVADIRNGTIV